MYRVIHYSVGVFFQSLKEIPYGKRLRVLTAMLLTANPYGVALAIRAGTPTEQLPLRGAAMDGYSNGYNANTP